MITYDICFSKYWYRKTLDTVWYWNALFSLGFGENYAKMCDLSLWIPVRVKFLSSAVCGRIWSFLRTSIHLLSKLRELIFWARSSFILWRFCSKPSRACLRKKNNWLHIFKIKPVHVYKQDKIIEFYLIILVKDCELNGLKMSSLRRLFT